jgi:hypothetical protein
MLALATTAAAACAGPDATCLAERVQEAERIRATILEYTGGRCAEGLVRAADAMLVGGAAEGEAPRPGDERFRSPGAGTAGASRRAVRNRRSM